MSERSKNVDPLSLKIGDMYSLSKGTPLMPVFSPSDPITAIERVQHIPVGDLIKVLSIKDKDGQPWYEVEVFSNNGDKVAKGWINSQALMKQNLQIKK